MFSIVSKQKSYDTIEGHWRPAGHWTVRDGLSEEEISRLKVDF